MNEDIKEFKVIVRTGTEIYGTTYSVTNAYAMVSGKNNKELAIEALKHLILKLKESNQSEGMVL